MGAKSMGLRQPCALTSLAFTARNSGFGRRTGARTGITRKCESGTLSAARALGRAGFTTHAMVDGGTYPNRDKPGGYDADSEEMAELPQFKQLKKTNL